MVLMWLSDDGLCDLSNRGQPFNFKAHNALQRSYLQYFLYGTSHQIRVRKGLKQAKVSTSGVSIIYVAFGLSNQLISQRSSVVLHFASMWRSTMAYENTHKQGTKVLLFFTSSQKHNWNYQHKFCHKCQANGKSPSRGRPFHVWMPWRRANPIQRHQ